MNMNVIVFGWNRSVPGREAVSGQHFQEFTEYLGTQQRNGLIESFEPVLLEPHGGSLNGFILIRGEPQKLARMVDTEDWIRHQARGLLHLDGSSVIRGVAGAGVAQRMSVWMQESGKLKT